MAKYEQDSNIPLSAAVWLANDEYAHDTRENHISVTTLLKSAKRIVLERRVAELEKHLGEVTPLVLKAMIASRLGTAIHNGIECAWKGDFGASMISLGYPRKIAERIKVNPTEEELKQDPKIIPVYLEQRTEKEIAGWVVSGMFDFIGDGRLEDFKSTGTYTYSSGNKDEDYILQGSLYRWLNPTKVTKDVMSIIWFFMDWIANKAATANYPPSRILEHKLNLISIENTETWVVKKLNVISKYIIDGVDCEDMVPCTNKELWIGDAKYSYFSDPSKLTRATKNFPSLQAANKWCADKGKGTVIVKPALCRACNYCTANATCKQAIALKEAGLMA